jgi:hypothetical protein
MPDSQKLEKPHPDARVVNLTSIALQTSPSQKVIDGVTSVLAYSDLSGMYPENPIFRGEVLRLLHRLSETLEAQGQWEVALRVRLFVAEERYLEASHLLDD